MKFRRISRCIVIAFFLWSTGTAFSEEGKPVGSVAGELPADHAECKFFGPDRERFLETGLYPLKGNRARAIALTREVTGKILSTGPRRTLAAQPARPAIFDRIEELGTIDRRLFQAMKDANVAPAAKTSDFEFIRRVMLDLTGRVPEPDRLLRFVSDSEPQKREKLVDELLASDAWLDKWTMYFGDLFKSAVAAPNLTRYNEGRDAFNKWIRESLAANKPYSQMATELIATSGQNSFQQGEVNWLLGGIVMGSPRTGQDHFDQQVANIADTFLGMSHMDCLLCHDGARHLDTLSLWGKNATRLQAWELAAFLSRTFVGSTPVPDTNLRYYFLQDNGNYRTDYPLNTQTGNRPARESLDGVKNVAPKYLFSGRGPKPDESYRVALVREVTGDLQFARTIVNYIWKEFFVVGLVDPVNQFDPARLDPDNPPPQPWTLQGSNPRLLNDLSREFAAGGFDLKGLMRRIVTSEAYQLSSRYDGEWRDEWETLYARKLVRRLWAEEIHDAVAQTSGMFPVYRIGGLTTSWAMQFPETRGTPGVRNISAFLDSFLRGDRALNERRSDGSPLQALNLMNNDFVVSRCRVTTSGGISSLAAKYVDYPDPSLVDAFFLTVLSRYPTEEEKSIAIAALQSGNRRQMLENLQWSLYNKVDFVFNY